MSKAKTRYLPGDKQILTPDEITGKEVALCYNHWRGYVLIFTDETWCMFTVEWGYYDDVEIVMRDKDTTVPDPREESP